MTALTQPAIDAGAVMMGLCVGDVVEFDNPAYGRMMYLSMGKHAIQFMTRNGYVHQEPRPVRNKLRVIGSVDISLLAESNGPKE